MKKTGQNKTAPKKKTHTHKHKETVFIFNQCVQDTVRDTIYRQKNKVKNAKLIVNRFKKIEIISYTTL